MTTGEFELTLTAMANGGSALGRHKKQTIFVPYAIPGERITARIVEDRGRFAHAEGVRLLEQAPERIDPRCPHFGPGRCGGCHWQHIDYEAQLHYKREVALDQLRRLANIDAPPVEQTLPSPDIWGYASHAVFYLLEGGQLAYMSTHPPALVPVEECHIIRPEILDLLDQLDLDYGDLERLTAQVGSDGVPMLILHTQDDLAPELAVDFPLNVNLLLSDNEPVNLIGAAHSVFEVKGRRFRVTAGGYFQPNVAAAAIVVDTVLDFLALRGDEAVLDLYAGVGVYAAFAAEQAALVSVVESYPPAATDADENLAGYEHVDVFEGGVLPVLEALLEEGEQYDAAILDPTPSGLGEEVCAALGEMGVARLVYVSSEPASLARDAKRLAGQGYRLRAVQPVDVAPQTFRMVCVAAFDRKA